MPACPCCGRTPEGEAPGERLRPGDGWCATCSWILLREVLEHPEWPVRCPTHGPLDRSDGERAGG